MMGVISRTDILQRQFAFTSKTKKILADIKLTKHRLTKLFLFPRHQESECLWLLSPVYTGPDKFGIDPRLGRDRPCVHMGPPGTSTMWVHLPGTMWVHLRKGPSTDLDRSRSRVNRQDRSRFGSVSLSTLSNRCVHEVAGSYSSLISA